MQIHKSETRGHANHGWLDTYHTFSFGMYHDSSRMHFGMLRVLNDDIVIGGAGFGKHGHDNMEIISIPLKGSLAHTDSTGNEGIISTSDVQIMSAGTGIMHAEYNASESELVNFLQLWIFPKERNIEPRYDQMRFDHDKLKNQLCPIVSNNPSIEALRINQDASLYLGEFDESNIVKHQMASTKHGVYVFVIEGMVTISGQELQRRDGMGIQDEESVLMHIASNSKILLIEVPV
ncbi:MAG: pirin family protein [Ignavibacteria bacterium]|jgi:redox-sensitive bicupin YhaK (pirin superfamily)